MQQTFTHGADDVGGIQHTDFHGGRPDVIIYRRNLV